MRLSRECRVLRDLPSRSLSVVVPVHLRELARLISPPAEQLASHLYSRPRQSRHPPPRPVGRPVLHRERLRARQRNASDSIGASLSCCNLLRDVGRREQLSSAHEYALRRLRFDDAHRRRRRRRWRWRRNQKGSCELFQIDCIRVVEAGYDRSSDENDVHQQSKQNIRGS